MIKKNNEHYQNLNDKSKQQPFQKTCNATRISNLAFYSNVSSFAYLAKYIVQINWHVCIIVDGYNLFYCLQHKFSKLKFKIECVFIGTVTYLEIKPQKTLRYVQRMIQHTFVKLLCCIRTMQLYLAKQIEYYVCFDFYTIEQNYNDICQFIDNV